MLTISNIIIADFNNLQVAFTANPFPFGYYYSKHMWSICLHLLIKPYRSNSKFKP